MISIINTYFLNAFFMIVILAMFATRSFTAIKNKTNLNRTLALIGTTALYVIADFAFIACDLMDFSLTAFKIACFVFYVIYTLLPFVWHVFTRSFVGTTFGKRVRAIELIPIIVLLGMVLLTPFTGLLWDYDANGTYIRGPLFTIYSYLNFFYYVESILDLLIIYIRREEKTERYAGRAMCISLVILIGSAVNGFVIPVGTIFPLMPFCSVVVAGLSYFFIASRDSDLVEMQRNQVIQNALDKAEEASREKTRFLSNMSHDIRTPMNAILNLTDLSLVENDIDKVHEYLKKTQISCKFLLGLINDILDVSRIESGAITLQKEKLTRSELLSIVDTVIRPMMEEKNLNFHLEMEPGEYTILVDKLRISQIFFNLLSNSVKYTPEGGDVWFEINTFEAIDNRVKVQFVVRDNGIGIGEEFIDNLFSPFSREQTDINRTVQGTGLGLSIVKGLVDSMDGTISVTSKLGEGTTFTVVICVETTSDEDTVESTVVPTELHSLEGLRVLLVEDNELNTYVAKVILENANCLVTTAQNGKEAFDLFCEDDSVFDVILMDVRMPIMDGLEATKAIRASCCANCRDIPIIAMTADVFEDERTTIFESGISDFLPKPINAKSLYKMLQKNLKHVRN
jgi:signal transduction histidine kinase/ActR/RegA family two-component response regulator